jgi:hypothetical protein
MTDVHSPVSSGAWRRSTLRLATLLLVPSALAAQQPRAMQLNDWYRVTQVSQPAMSPDGRHVALTVTTVPGGENRRHQEVWVVPTAGGAPQRIEGFCETDGVLDGGNAAARPAVLRALATAVPQIDPAAADHPHALLALPVLRAGQVAAVVAWTL